MFILQFAMGHGLENKIKNTGRPQLSGWEKRQKRDAMRGKEWDIRVTVDEDYTAEHVIKKLDEQKEKILWYLVGGAELGIAKEQKGDKDPHTLDAVLPYEHHHICLVLNEETNYQGVGTLLGTMHRIGKYIAVRDPKHTYAGWIIHATKTKTKVDQEKRQIKEYGTRPIDEDTEENERKIRYMVRKYGDTEAKLQIGIVPRAAKAIREKRKYERQEQRVANKKKQKIDQLRKNKEAIDRQLAELENEL